MNINLEADAILEDTEYRMAVENEDWRAAHDLACQFYRDRLCSINEKIEALNYKINKVLVG